MYCHRAVTEHIMQYANAAVHEKYVGLKIINQNDSIFPSAKTVSNNIVSLADRTATALGGKGRTILLKIKRRGITVSADIWSDSCEQMVVAPS